jgi:hypothetical protein
MTWQVNYTHPVVENPQTFRAAAALAGAGAWDAAPLEIATAGYAHLTLFLEYTRGAAGGAFDFQLQVSPTSADIAGEDWYPQSLYAAGAVAAGADTQSRVQREYVTYASQGAAIETFIYGPLLIAGGAERIRVRARESGSVGNPGTVRIRGTLFV